MLLKKNTIKDVGVGDFCYINDEDRMAMMNSYHYKKTGSNNNRWPKTSHIVDMEIMYVVSENIFDCSNLIKIIPVSSSLHNVRKNMVQQLSQGKYYIVNKSSLKLIDDKEIIKDCKENRWITNIISIGFGIKL